MQPKWQLALLPSSKVEVLEKCWRGLFLDCSYCQEHVFTVSLCISTE